MPCAYVTLSSATAVATPNATEGTVLVSEIVGNVSDVGEGRLVHGVLNVTAGAGTTAVVVRVRQGSGTGGTLVGVAQTVTLAAASTASIYYAAPDPGTTASQYTVTIQQTGGTGAGTVNLATISVTEPEWRNN